MFIVVTAIFFATTLISILLFTMWFLALDFSPLDVSLILDPLWLHTIAVWQILLSALFLPPHCNIPPSSHPCFSVDLRYHNFFSPPTANPDPSCFALVRMSHRYWRRRHSHLKQQPLLSSLPSWCFYFCSQSDGTEWSMSGGSHSK